MAQPPGRVPRGEPVPEAAAGSTVPLAEVYGIRANGGLPDISGGTGEGGKQAWLREGMPGACSGSDTPTRPREHCVQPSTR